LRLSVNSATTVAEFNKGGEKMKEFVLMHCESNVFIVPYCATKYVSTGEFECLLVPSIDFFGKCKKTFSDLVIAKEFYGDYIYYDRSDLKKEPRREGDLICVYSSDVKLIGTDPYFWKYPELLFEYWNTIELETYVAKDYEILEQVKKFRILGTDYFVLKNYKSKYVVCCNDVDPDLMLIEEKFEDFEDAMSYIRYILGDKNDKKRDR